jgi:hypothetical protein
MLPTPKMVFRKKSDGRTATQVFQAGYERFKSGSMVKKLGGCVMALLRMESGRRNAFYSSIKGDGQLVDRAIYIVKGSKK